jgi:hypothetical protein
LLFNSSSIFLFAAASGAVADKRMRAAQDAAAALDAFISHVASVLLGFSHVNDKLRWGGAWP